MGFVRSARLAMLGIAAGCILGGSGCAAERDPIDRVQLGALPKAFFLGPKYDDVSDDPEFYFRTTVVDVSAGAGSEELFTSSDAEPTSRIRWEVTETQLIGRLAYELVDGTDLTGTKGGPRNDEPTAKAPARITQDGQIVCAFAITKQFDIRRDYNPGTGEENNIVVENDSDRVWNQRDYIRVDWSRNLVTTAYDLDAVSQMGLYGGVKFDPVAYYVNDPSHPDAPVLDMENGYLDVTTKAFASPQLVTDPDFGDFPACMLTGNYPVVSCNPSEVKLRHSFKKVADTDYQPEDYDGKKMDVFGFFTSDRYGYDRRYGVVDQKWHRFIARWNLWDKSHASPPVACNTDDTTPPGVDPHRDDDKNGTEDECEKVGRGSRCDEFTHACTIPLRDRKMHTTPWYVNREFPAELFDNVRKVVDTWSDAVRVGVLSGRLAECRRTQDSDCEATMGWPAKWSDDFVPPYGSASLDQVPRAFVLCHNPVDPKNDDPACGKEGLSPRMGDLRYNFISYIVSPQAASPWGIMVDAEDPITGEKVAGSVNQWGAVLDKAAAVLADLVQLLNGTTSPDQFIAGQNVSEWVQENLRTQGGNMPAAMSADELASRMSAFDPKVMAPFATGKGKPRSASPVLRHRQRMKDLEASGKVGMGDGAILQRFGKLRGSELEAKLVTPEVAQMSGYNPNDAISKGVIDRASPFARTSPAMRRILARRALLGRAQRHACRYEDPQPDHLLGLAHKAQKLFGPVDPKNPSAVYDQREKIFQWARQEYVVGVFSHEFGHSMGLRHNFAGTFDATNYDNRYWQLRTSDGKVTQACGAGTTDGTNCIGPRYNDPVTQAEIDGGINGYATSSVMDYPGDQALDMYLIGKYDKAAMRMGYGGTVDVWAAQGMSVKGSGDGQTKAFHAVGLADSVGLFGVRYFNDPGKTDTAYIHYSKFQNEFGLIQNCHADQDSPLGTSCDGAPLDVVDYRDMQDFAPIPDYASFSTISKVVDDKGRVRRGYMFSSDEFADTGNVPSFRYDAGADPYEQIRFLESAYENRYVLDGFRRNRTMFNSYDQVSRVQSHYLDTIQLIAKTYAFAMVLENDDPSKPDPKLLDEGNYGPLGVGATVAFDMYARMLTRPEPGDYCSTAESTCPGVQPFGLVNSLYEADSSPLPSQIKYDFAIPLGSGRYLHNDFDYGQGYWWSDYQKQVGSFYEKTWAIYYMSEAFDSFISNSKEDFVDGRYKNVNFATVYPDQMRRMLGALFTGDADTYAPWTDGGGGGGGIPAANVVYPAWHNLADLGTRPANPKLLDPLWGWNEQLYAMVWGTMFLPTSWTQDFINDARITALASEQISWPAAETITFIDPVTNITYRAHTTGTETLFGTDVQKTVGARMLDWANGLLCTAYLCQTDAKGFILLNTDGTPKLKLDANSKPQLDPQQPGGDQALKKFVTNIEVMRQLVSTFVRPLQDSLPQP